MLSSDQKIEVILEIEKTQRTKLTKQMTSKTTFGGTDTHAEAAPGVL